MRYSAAFFFNTNYRADMPDSREIPAKQFGRKHRRRNTASCGIGFAVPPIIQTFVSACGIRRLSRD
jgi:hypothetical protein